MDYRVSAQLHVAMDGEPGQAHSILLEEEMVMLHADMVPSRWTRI